MADSVIGGEIIFRFVFGNAGNQAVELIPGPVGGEHRPYLGAEGVHMRHPVAHFRRPRQFVFLHQALLVGVHRSHGDKTGLHMIAHGLAINVEAVACIPCEYAGVDETVEIFPAFGVHGGIVCIDFRAKIDLGSVDMQEAVGIAPGHGRGFLAAKYIVGRRGDPGGEFRGRAQAPERSDEWHGEFHPAQFGGAIIAFQPMPCSGLRQVFAQNPVGDFGWEAPVGEGSGTGAGELFPGGQCLLPLHPGSFSWQAPPGRGLLIPYPHPAAQ